MSTENETPRTFRVQSRDNICESLLTEGGGAGEGVQEHLDMFHVPISDTMMVKSGKITIFDICFPTLPSR